MDWYKFQKGRCKKQELFLKMVETNCVNLILLIFHHKVIPFGFLKEVKLFNFVSIQKNVVGGKM
jgi:hypothetical protein